MATNTSQQLPHSGMEYLVEVIQLLSHAQSLEEIVEITRTSARRLTQADGATFILRDGDLCHYKDEEAIAPLWKGRRFPMSHCVSGWAMLNKATAVIPDIYDDPRVPAEAYRPTFVKSLVMVPIRKHQPIGAIGNYWAECREATPHEIRLLEALADSTAIALENVRLIEDLKKVNASLENSLEARNEFLSIASHELKTPLTSLLMQLQMSRRQINNRENPPSFEKLEKSLGIAEKQAWSLGDLIERLMEVSKMKLELLKLDYSHCNLSTVIKEAVEKLVPSLEAADCVLRWDIDSNVETDCDRDAIEQVTTTLISNVIKYAVGADVMVSLRKPNYGVILLSVSDDGPGIPKDMHQKVFERFGRAISPANISGFGLGLFVAKGLVEAHQGRIFLESDLGQGTKFSVELPCIRRSL